MKASELKKIVGLLAPCLGDAEIIPALAYLCFDREGVYAYNDVVATRYQWKHGLGSFGVVGKGLASLLGGWGDRQLELSTVKDNGLLRLQMKAKKSITKLPALPISQFVFEEPELKGIKGKITELTRLDEVLESVADSSVNPVLKAVTLSAKKGDPTIMAYASDGPTLIHAKVGKLTFPSKVDRNWIVPKLAVSQMLAVSDGDLALYLGKEGVIAKSGQSVVISKLVTGEPPDFNAPLEKGEKVGSLKNWKSNKHLEDALATACVIYNEADNALCFFRLEDEVLHISIRATTGSEFTDKVVVEGLKESKLEFHANPNGMLKAFQLGSLLKDSRCVLQDRAAIFGSGSSFLYATSFMVVAGQQKEISDHDKVESGGKGIKIKKKAWSSKQSETQDEEIPF